MTTSEARTEPSTESMAEARSLFDKLIAHTRFEWFEPGMDSDFSRGLETALLGDFGDAMLQLLAEYLDDPEVNTENANETMRLLGRFQHPPSQDRRLHILTRALGHPDPYLRDSAGLALVDLEDRRAVAALERAAACEPIPSLRDDLLQAAAQLV